MHARPDPRLRFALLIAVIGCAAAACEKEQAGQGLALKEGLQAAEEARRLPPLKSADVDSIDDVIRVLRRPYASAAPRLGGLRQRLAAAYRVVADGQDELALEESISLDLDVDGQYALRHANRSGAHGDDHEDGRACWWVDGAYYTARHHGPATRIPIRSYEQDRCLETGIEPLAGLVRLLAPHLSVTPAGEGSVADRAVVRTAISRAGRELEIPPAVPRAWPEGADAGTGGAVGESPAIWGPRDTLVSGYARPRTVKGELAFDVETGALIAGQFEAELVFVKAGHEATLVLRVALTAEPFGGTIVAPEDARVYSPRPRIFEDRRRLLRETFKSREPIALPKPGDAPPLQVTPGSEVEAAAAAPPPVSDEEEGAEDAPPAIVRPVDDEDAPP